VKAWLGARWLVLGVGVAAALPFLVSAIDAVAVDWTAYGDDAVIAVRSIDVFSANSPLVGQWTSGPAEVLGEFVYTPAPTLYWLLALPTRLPDPRWMAVLMGLLNAGCVIGAVILAHRRGGPGLMLGTAIAIPIMLASLPSQTYNDVWNPSVPLPPLLLLAFVAWSLACGEHRLLPLTGLLASFIVATHLSYVAPAVAVTVVGLGGLVLARRRQPAGERRRLWPWALAAAAITLACWIPPLIDEARNDPGNLARLRTTATADEAKLGREAGVRAVVHTVGIPPWWLQPPREPLERIGDLANAPSALSTATAALVLAALAAAGVLGLRRRRLDVAAGAAVALALCAAVAADASSTPRDAFDTVYYTLRWASVAGMFGWLVLGWAVATLLRLPDPLRRHRTTVTAVGAAAVVAVGAAVAFSVDAPTEPYRPVRAAVERVKAELPPDAAVRVDAAGEGNGIFLAVNFQAGIVYALRHEGREVVAPTIAKLLGEAYADGDYEERVRVDVDRPAPPGNRVVARLSVRDTFESADDPKHDVTVSLAPAATARRSARGSRAGSPQRRIAWSNPGSRAGRAPGR
jgi:hypothetical protein